MSAPGRILVVDDDPRNLRLLEALLRSDGHAVAKAASGQEAIRSVRDSMPDLVLLDVMMPGEDGISVCRRLRSEESFRLLPIVMVTALNALEDKVHGLRAGADDFLVKPVRKEELLAKVRALLRVRALQRELEDSRRELAERNRELEALAAYKTQLTQMLVHDLRGPLTGIGGNLDLALEFLERGREPEKAGAPLRRAQESSRQLARLVADILDVGRLEENRMEIRIVPVDLHALFRECAEGAAALAEREGIRVVTDAAEDAAVARADPELLRRIVGNLVQNALRFAGAGGEIRLRARRRGGEVQILVSDTGPGIPADERGRIFERFHRGAESGERSRGGYGLGLAFCRLAAEAHGGRIWVEDADTGGSLFVVGLPERPPVGIGAAPAGAGT